MKVKYHFKTASLLLVLLLPIMASAQKIGIFDGQTDIGKNVKPGSATFIPQTQQYVISGAGYNIWFDHDEFHYVWKK